MTNSREKFLAALRGQQLDAPPLAHVAALTTVSLQQATGCQMPDVHFDPEKQARLLAANHHTLGFDAVTFIINYFGEPAALGVQMDWGGPDQLPVYTSHPWRRPDDAVVPEDLLDRPPVSHYLETLRIAKRDYGARFAVLGKVMGPFSMAQVMHGVEPLMTATIDAPDRVRDFLDICVGVLVRCGNAQLEVGVDALAIGEGGAGASMLSPRMYEQLVLPSHQRMIEQLDGPAILHMCGDMTPRLPMIQRIGAACFNFDWAIPPETMVAAAAGKFSVMGNVNTLDLLNAPPEEIQRQTRRCVEAGVQLISPGCALSPRCPDANLRAMRAAIDDAARSP